MVIITATAVLPIAKKIIFYYPIIRLMLKGIVTDVYRVVVDKGVWKRVPIPRQPPSPPNPLLELPTPPSKYLLERYWTEKRGLCSAPPSEGATRVEDIYGCCPRK